MTDGEFTLANIAAVLAIGIGIALAMVYGWSTP